MSKNLQHLKVGDKITRITGNGFGRITPLQHQTVTRVTATQLVVEFSTHTLRIDRNTGKEIGEKWGQWYDANSDTITSIQRNNESVVAHERLLHRLTESLKNTRTAEEIIAICNNVAKDGGI